jgi:hypothetical protein
VVVEVGELRLDRADEFGERVDELDLEEPPCCCAAEITNKKSILPWQPIGLPSVKSGTSPRSGTSVVVPPVLVSPEPAAPLVVVLMSPELELAAAGGSVVDPPGAVVIFGMVANADESEAGAWQAPTTASSSAPGCLTAGTLACHARAFYPKRPPTGDCASFYRADDADRVPRPCVSRLQIDRDQPTAEQGSAAPGSPRGLRGLGLSLARVSADAA